MAKEIVSHKRLKEVLNFDPETGIFTWLINTGKKQKKGKEAGCISSISGYRVIGIDKRIYTAHRLAIFFINGIWPDHTDHINGERSDNRINNLRDVSASMNSQNQRRARVDNKTTGLLGVHKCKDSKWFYARIQVNRTVIRLGRFVTAELAHAAYLEAKRLHHPGCTI